MTSIWLQVLDAPALQDDFYLNLVDWSAQNVLAVGLGTCVYLWSACTSKVCLPLMHLVSAALQCCTHWQYALILCLSFACKLIYGFSSMCLTWMDGQTDRRTDRRTDRCTDRQTDGWMEGQVHGWMDEECGMVTKSVAWCR